MSDQATLPNSEASMAAALAESSPVETVDASKGAGDRFTARMALPNETVREGSDADLNAKPEKKEAPGKKEGAAPPKKEEAAIDKKSDIPDFSKQPEKKEEPDDQKALEEELKQHPAVKGEAAKSFAKIRAEREEARKALAAKETEFAARIQELESKASTAPSKEQQAAYEAVQKRAQQLEEELGKASIERTPAFQRFTTAEKAELEAAKSYMDGDEAKQAAIETASHLKGKQRIGVLNDAGMSADEIAIVGSNLARIDQIRRDKGEAVDNWKSTLQSHEQQTKAQQAEQEERQKQFEAGVFKTVSEKLIPDIEAYRKMDGFDDWNKGVDERLARTQRYFSGEASLEELAAIVVKGEALDATRKILTNTQEKLEKAMAELSRLKAATPPNGSVKNGGDNPQDQGTAASRFDATLAQVRGQ